MATPVPQPSPTRTPTPTDATRQRTIAGFKANGYVQVDANTWQDSTGRFWTINGNGTERLIPAPTATPRPTQTPQPTQTNYQKAANNIEVSNFEKSMRTPTPTSTPTDASLREQWLTYFSATRNNFDKTEKGLKSVVPKDDPAFDPASPKDTWQKVIDYNISVGERPPSLKPAPEQPESYQYAPPTSDLSRPQPPDELAPQEGAEISRNSGLTPNAITPPPRPVDTSRRPGQNGTQGGTAPYQMPEYASPIGTQQWIMPGTGGDWFKSSPENGGTGGHWMHNAPQTGFTTYWGQGQIGPPFDQQFDPNFQDGNWLQPYAHGGGLTLRRPALVIDAQTRQPIASLAEVRPESITPRPGGFAIANHVPGTQRYPQGAPGLPSAHFDAGGTLTEPNMSGTSASPWTSNINAPVPGWPEANMGGTSAQTMPTAPAPLPEGTTASPTGSGGSGAPPIAPIGITGGFGAPPAYGGQIAPEPKGGFAPPAPGGTASDTNMGGISGQPTALGGFNFAGYNIPGFTAPGSNPFALNDLWGGTGGIPTGIDPNLLFQDWYKTQAQIAAERGGIQSGAAGFQFAMDAIRRDLMAREQAEVGDPAVAQMQRARDTYDPYYARAGMAKPTDITPAAGTFGLAPGTAPGGEGFRWKIQTPQESYESVNQPLTLYEALTQHGISNAQDALNLREQSATSQYGALHEMNPGVMGLKAGEGLITPQQMQQEQADDAAALLKARQSTKPGVQGSITLPSGTKVTFMGGQTLTAQEQADDDAALLRARVGLESGQIGTITLPSGTTVTYEGTKPKEGTSGGGGTSGSGGTGTGMRPPATGTGSSGSGFVRLPNGNIQRVAPMPPAQGMQVGLSLMTGDPSTFFGFLPNSWTPVHSYTAGQALNVPMGWQPPQGYHIVSGSPGTSPVTVAPDSQAGAATGSITDLSSWKAAQQAAIAGFAHQGLSGPAFDAALQQWMASHPMPMSTGGFIKAFAA